MLVSRLAPTFALTLALAACNGASDTEGAGGGAGGSTVNQDVAAHVAVIEQRIAASNAHDFQAWASLHTPDVIRTAPELTEPLVGPEALVAALQGVESAFPDYHLELEQAFGQGEWLSIRVRTRGTNTGPLDLGGFDLPPTNKPITQEWSAVVRFREGKISEFHEYYDQYTLLVQLGLAQ